MKIGILVGSMQSPSNSAKVAHYLQRQAQEQGHQVYILDLGQNPLPLWGSPSQDPAWPARLDNIQQQLADCQGFVLISPEYNGMVPAALKNALLYFGQDVLGHKPAYLVGVSAGTGGAYPIAELRLNSSKNNRLCYLPEHAIVRQADSVLNPTEPNDAKADAFIRKRLDYGMGLLLEYAQALLQVRQSGRIDPKAFANGM